MVAVHDTYAYIESMTEEQLASAEQLLAAKENIFDIPKETEKNQKVYTKSNKQQ